MAAAVVIAAIVASVAVAPPGVARPPLVGMVAGRLDAPLVAKLHHVQEVRVEFGTTEPLSHLRAVVAAYAREGVRVLPLAGFHQSMPTPQQAANLGRWAADLGPGGRFWRGRRGGDRLAIRDIEFGNETSYSYQYGDGPADPSYVARAQTYALRARAAQEAIARANPRVGLLVQGDDGDTSSPVWVDGMFAAVPDLASRVAGWTIHPYGPGWALRMDRMRAQLAVHGVAEPAIWVTEWGLSTDGGRCLSDNYGYDPCMAYGTAAMTLLADARAMTERYGPGLRALFVYALRDAAPSGRSGNREGYFGAFHSRGAVKGAYTRAVRALMNDR